MDTNEESWGELRCSADILEYPEALRARMAAEGYLFVRGFFERAAVLEVRRSMVARMSERGWLKPGTDPMEAVIQPNLELKFAPELAQDNQALDALLYAGRMLAFYRSFFGEDVLHFNYTWLRAKGPGRGTRPHCDMVYMGRGTRERLFTAWMPIGDVPLDLGGLMLLEGSHLQGDRLRQYLERDVDSYCRNRPEAKAIESGKRPWAWDGVLSSNPALLRERLGGRWLSTNYQAGDLLTFPMQMVHTSLDNQTDRVRLSTDSRYQPTSEPADERWVGHNPIGHSRAAKRGRIC